MGIRRALSLHHLIAPNLLGTCLPLALIVALTGCGGSNGTTSISPTSALKTQVQINMGDAPANWMLAFSMNISSMSLTGSNGSVSVVSSTIPIEMMHLMGTMQPLSMIAVPQGSYTGASITIGSATVMYMDPTTKVAVQRTISGPISSSVSFSSPVTLGSTPMAMGFDLDLASSVTADVNGNLAMNPVFHVTSGMQGAGNPLDFTNGGIQQMMGTISSVSGTSFVMNSIQVSQSFSFGTNSSTVFANTSMSGMASGMVTIVNASLQPDGSLMATKVQSMMSSGGVMGGGIITATNGQPATALTMVMQNGAGAGMMSSSFASGASINLSGSTTYQIDVDGMNMLGLPFNPIFDASHIYAGQSVMPISSTSMTSGGMMGGGAMAGTITASTIALQPQGMSGTVATTITAGLSTSFTLTLPSDSAFKTMTGATNVTVFEQPGTTISGTSPIAGGSTVHAFGLLFFDVGQWKMVAARISSD